MSKQIKESNDRETQEEPEITPVSPSNSIYVNESEKWTSMAAELLQLKQTVNTQARLIEELLRTKSQNPEPCHDEAVKLHKNPKSLNDEATSSHQKSTTGQSNFFTSTPNKIINNRSVLTDNVEEGSSNPPMISFSEAQCHKMIMALSNRTISMPVWHGEKPKFSANLHEQPMKFLELFENYCKANGITENQSILFKSCLEDSASDWADMQSPKLDYNSLKLAFIEYFWSQEKQINLKKKIMLVRYTQTKHSSFTNFFLKKISQFKYLTPPLSEAVVCYEIMQLLPLNIHSLWSATADRSIAGTLQFLDRVSFLDRHTKDLPYFDPKYPPPKSGNFNREK